MKLEPVCCIRLRPKITGSETLVKLIFWYNFRHITALPSCTRGYAKDVRFEAFYFIIVFWYSCRIIGPFHRILG